MKKQADSILVPADEMRPEYDFDYSKAKPNRYASRMRPGSRVIVLEPDVAAAFPTAELANEALRQLIDRTSEAVTR